MKKLFLLLYILYSIPLMGQDVMTPELLLSLKKVVPIEMTPSGNHLLYNLYKPDVKGSSTTVETKIIDLSNRREKVISNLTDAQVMQVLPDDKLLVVKDDKLHITDIDGFSEYVLLDDVGNRTNFKLSPDGNRLAFSEEVQYQLVKGNDIYSDLPDAELYIYDDLNYRHWDTWFDGKISHVYVADIISHRARNIVDVLHSEPYDCPQKPFGGAEDFVWDKKGNNLIYVCKKSTGRKYAESTNTDLYVYNVPSKKTESLTLDMKGYDTQPVFSNSGTKLAWLSMKRDGYESDKNDIYIYDLITGDKKNLTADWDGTVQSMHWGPDDQTIFFVAPTMGTQQIFTVGTAAPEVKQLTEGVHNIKSILGFKDTEIILTKQSMNQATEIYSYNGMAKEFTPLTQANTEVYAGIERSKIEARIIKTVDNKDMLVWVVYPPNFDSTKKYPTLLYCQGGPQAQVSQFYSFRWNFQLMAAQGYIVLAPNRRGLPGFGVAWNEQISQDWGGMAMKDYMQTTDVLSKEIPAIDPDRIGAVGASYGGYSVYMLAGIHNNRYKTFIAHCGLFDLKSWYGTTEELWFANWDLGGPYYQSESESYKKYSPSDYVKNWNKPMLIFQGGRDYRVPIGQGLQAYQAAQVMGLKSRLVYLPEENHWVLQSQNALAWQREFYRWLEETL